MENLHIQDGETTMILMSISGLRFALSWDGRGG